MKRSLVGGVTGIVLFGLASSAHALVLTGDEPIIDDFTTTDQVVAPFVFTNSQAAPAGAVGDRTISLEGSSGPGEAIFLGGGMARFAGFSGTVYTIEYGLASALNLLLPGISFDFEVKDTDLDENGLSAAFTTTLTSGDGGVTESATIQIDGEGDYKIPFDLFALTDFSDIDYIKFTLDTTGMQNIDVTIGPIVDALPEPATLTLFGLGLLGVGHAMRKKRA